MEVVDDIGGWVEDLSDDVGSWVLDGVNGVRDLVYDVTDDVVGWIDDITTDAERIVDGTYCFEDDDPECAEGEVGIPEPVEPIEVSDLAVF